MSLFLKCVQRGVDTGNLPGHVFQGSIWTCPDVKQSDYPPHDSGMQDRVPLTSVSLNCRYFSERVAFIFQSVARRSKVTSLQKNNQNFGIIYLQLLSHAVSNCEALPQPTPTCTDMFKTITAHIYLWSFSIYTAVYKVLKAIKKCTMTAVA